MSRSSAFPRAVAALAAAGLSLTAAAAAAGDSAWYVAAGFGRSELDATFGKRWPKTFDDESSGISLAVGYQVHRFLSVEAGFHELGEFAGTGSPCAESDPVCIASLVQLGLCVEGEQCDPLVAVALDAEVDGYSLSALPQWPATDRLTGFGRLGILAWNADVTAGSFGFAGQRIDDFSGKDLMFGLGLRYRFLKGLSLSAELQKLDLDAQAARGGLSWRF